MEKGRSSPYFSLAVEYTSFNELVMHLMVPLMKHTPSKAVRTTGAALLDVAEYISSVMGIYIRAEDGFTIS
jgi:hypothetical protein